MTARRNQQKHRQLRQAAAKISALIQSEYGEYEPPDRSSCERFYEYTTYPENVPGIIITQYIWMKDSVMVEFAALASAYNATSIEPEKLARVDIKHGHSHLHRVENDVDVGAPVHIMRIDNQTDLQECLARSLIFLAQYAYRIYKEKGYGDE